MKRTQDAESPPVAGKEGEPVRQGLQRLQQNKKQGLSLAFVTCAGAFLLAFALMLIYTASAMMANANRKLAEERCYQLARSFAEVAGRELDKPESAFCKFANQFLDDSAYNEYHPDHPETVYHYTLQTEEDEKYGGIEMRLCKEINQDNLAGLEGTIEPPAAGSGTNYTERIKTLQNTKFQRHLLLIEVIARQGNFMYNFTTEYYREDQYPVVFRYEDRIIVWDDVQNIWRYDNALGNECVFDSSDVKITYTYDTANPVKASFYPMYETGGGSG